MSTVSNALRSEKTQTNEVRTVAGIVNSIETLEGGGFLVRRPFPKACSGMNVPEPIEGPCRRQSIMKIATPIAIWIMCRTRPE